MALALARFALVGVLNTAIGFTAILFALRLGMGDYAANATGYALGLAVSYALNRSWTFRATNAANLAELGRFATAFAVAYGGNLGVLAVGRAAGLAGNLMLHLAGLCVYSVLFFVLSRWMVFCDGR